jgi:hypothetical protein
MVNLTKIQISHWLSYDLYTDEKLGKATELDYLTTIRKNLMTYLQPFFSVHEKVGLIVHLLANANNPHLYYLTADFQVQTNQGAAVDSTHNPPGTPPTPPAPRIIFQKTEFKVFDDSNFLRVEAKTLVSFGNGTMKAAGKAAREAL